MRQELKHGGLTPQKKCRMKMTRHVLATPSVCVYRLENLCALLSLSKTSISPAFASSFRVGSLSSTLMLPLKSAGGPSGVARPSFTAIVPAMGYLLGLLGTLGCGRLALVRSSRGIDINKEYCRQQSYNQKQHNIRGMGEDRKVFGGGDE